MPDRRFTPKKKPTGNRSQAMLLFVLAIALVGSLLMLWPPNQSINRGLNLRGGVSVVLSLAKPDGSEISRAELRQTRDIMVERLNLLRETEVDVQILGSKQLLVQIPADVDKDFILSIIGTRGYIEFVDMSAIEDQELVTSIQYGSTIPRSTLKALGFMSTMPDTDPSATLFVTDTPTGDEDAPKRYFLPDSTYNNPLNTSQLPLASLKPSNDWKPVYFQPDTYTSLFNSTNISSAKAYIDMTSYYGDYAVSVVADDRSISLLVNSETDLVSSRQVMVLLDGFATRGRISSSDFTTNTLVLTGSFTEAYSVGLGVIIETGATPLTVSVASEKLGSSLGQDVIQNTIVAVLVALAVLFVYLVVYYRGLGLVVALSAVVFSLVTLGVLALLSFYGFFTLTLASVAGLVLACMCLIDSSLLLLERLRDEVSMGRPVRTSVNNSLAYANKASIGVVALFIVIGVLVYIIDSGLLRGFGTALAIGAAVEILVTQLGTYPLVRLLTSSMIEANPSFWILKSYDESEAQSQRRRINFLSSKNVYFIVSVLLIIASTGIVFFRGVSFGFEFDGGSAIVVSDTGGLTLAEVRSACSKAKLANPVVQSTYNSYNDESGFIIKTTTDDSEALKDAKALIETDLGLEAGQAKVSALGPSWRDASTLSSLLTFGAVVLAVLIYAVIRLGYKGAFSAFIALTDTLLLVSTIYMAIGLPVVPLHLPALLAVCAYASYTTILILRRINENVENTTEHSFITVANLTINQFYTRTVNITVAVLVPMLVLLAFGGSSMRGFAIYMIIGTIACPLSTIMIAAPIYVLLKQREPKFKKLLDKYGDGMDEFTVAEQLGE